MLLLFIVPPIAQPTYFKIPPMINQSGDFSENQATEIISESLVSDQQTTFLNNPGFPGVRFLPNDDRNMTYIYGEKSSNLFIENNATQLSVSKDANYDNYNLTLDVDILTSDSKYTVEGGADDTITLSNDYIYAQSANTSLQLKSFTIKGVIKKALMLLALLFIVKDVEIHLLKVIL